MVFASQNRRPRRAAAVPVGRQPQTEPSAQRARAATTRLLLATALVSTFIQSLVSPGWTLISREFLPTIACDPSCESCSGPNATCLTCRSGLQPDSSDGTRCVTATTASTNGTFVTCPSRTFWDSAISACVECNPLCETCFAAGVDGCLSCRSPNVLMPNGGGCVAFDSGTGLCNGAGATNATTRVANGWVYDNRKKVCDGRFSELNETPSALKADSLNASHPAALPPKCAAGGIDSFSSSSTRAGLRCSACLPGSYLIKGSCVDTCPDGMMVSIDGKSCQGAFLPQIATSSSSVTGFRLQARTIRTDSLPLSQRAIRLAPRARARHHTARPVPPPKLSSSMAPARPLPAAPSASTPRPLPLSRPGMRLPVSRVTQTARFAPVPLHRRAFLARPPDPS